MIRSNLLLLLAAGLLGGCAATMPSELANAQHAYLRASSGPAATLVPAELHKAQEALRLAEESFEDDPRGYRTKDLAYVAQRKAQLAEALAAGVAEQKTAVAANSQFDATQEAIVKDTKAQLDVSQSNLAASQSVVVQTEAELAASKKAQAEAEARATAAFAALAKLAAVKEEARGLVITLSGSVLFASDESSLLPEAQRRLAQVAEALLATKERSIVIEGHTDSQGSDADNVGLSQRRAEAVRTFLTGQGYDSSRIRAVGIGESRPVADNASPEGRANNRRVEIVVVPR